MQRVVYAPEVFAYVYTSLGNYIDLSPDIISGTLTRNVNDLSTVKLLLQNTTNPVDPITPGINNRVYMGGQITPMDRITVYLKRDKPVQVFSGYIDLAPYWQPYPRPIQLEASCTLKRLQFTYWDPGIPSLISLLSNLGFTPNPAGLSAGFSQTDYATYAGRPSSAGAQAVGENQPDPNVADTGFIALLRFLLEDVGQWTPNSVYIEPIPVSWLTQAYNIFQQVIDDEDTIYNTLNALFTTGNGSNTPSDVGQSGVPVSQFKGSSELFINDLRSWIDTEFKKHQIIKDTITGNSYARGLAFQAYTWGKKNNVDPRLLIALAALTNFGIVEEKLGNYNLYGGTKKYTSWHQCISETALLFAKNKFGRTSIKAIFDGTGGSKWFSTAPAGPRSLKSSTITKDMELVANYYQDLLDHTGGSNITWDAATIHPTNFKFPTSPPPRKPKKVTAPPPPIKNAYVEIHAVDQFGKDVHNYATEGKDNATFAEDLKNYIKDHLSWKMSVAHYGKGFDTVYHDISIFVRHYPNTAANANKISISVSPHASANSLRLAEDIREGLTDRGFIPTTADPKLGPDRNYVGLTKEHAAASVVIQLPAIGFAANTSVMVGIANGIYKYKFKTLNPSLTESPTFSTKTGSYGWRVFAKAYKTKVVPQDVDSGQNFSFKGTVPYYALAAGKVIYNKPVSVAGVKKNSTFISINPPIGGYDVVFYIGGDPNKNNVAVNKTIRAGELLGRFTSKEDGLIGFTTSALAKGGKIQTGTILSPSGPAGDMHNFLVGQMPDLVNNTKANIQWVQDPSYKLVTAAPVGSTPTTGSVPQVSDAAFNVTLDVPLDLTSSQLLTGYRSYENNIKLADSVEQAVTSSMRVFSSLPDGSFIAWYPDYFNLSGEVPYYYISANEVVDFTIDLNDSALITHSYVIGAPYGPSTFDTTQTTEMIYGAGVASIDMPGIFDSFFGTNATAKNLSDAQPFIKQADAITKFFNKYGVRPQLSSQSSLRNPLIEFFYAYHELMKSWAQQYISNISLTFLPELFPGMIVQIETKDTANPAYCVYVEQVTHNFDYEQGFTTTAQVSALSRPRTIDAGSASIASLQPGGLSESAIKPNNPPNMALINNNGAYANAVFTNAQPNINYSPQPGQISTILASNGATTTNTQQLIQSLGWGVQNV